MAYQAHVSSGGHRAIAALTLAAVTLATATPCAADEAPIRDANAEHPRVHFDIDVTLLNIGISVAGHVGSGFYLGMGASVLPAISVTTFARYPLEIFEAHAFARYDLVRTLQIDLGGRVSHFEYFCIWGECTESEMFGGYADLRVGLPYFKIGPRVEYAVQDDTGTTGLLVWPLLLRGEFTP
jgi:hypothetical protein